MEGDEKMVTSDGENNEDDSSSSEDEEEKKFEARAEELEREIANNKYLYDVHVELVDLYQKLGDLKSLRAAYERFSEYFPLTPAIWLTWIRNEIKLVSSLSEKKYVLSLFEKAVEDYLSVDVWLEYIQFAIGNCELEETYSIVEKALNAAGLHTAQGSLIWDAFRELELAHLALHESLSEEWHKQAGKVADAFRRQLSVPLLEMKNTYVEWQQWLKSLPEGHKIDLQDVDWSYQKALKMLTRYEKLEQYLLEAEEDEIVRAYCSYINVVTDPATILCLYERAMAHLSLNAELWCKYCFYSLKLGEIALDVSKRALRNCPWSEDLWVVRMRILEQLQHSDKEVTECLEQGLIAVAPSRGLNLWLTYLEFMRRSSESHEKLHKIFTQAAEQLDEAGDPTFKVLRWQARLYARKGNMTKARSIWANIMHYPSHSKSATAWLEYAGLEKQYGTPHQLRILYQRAMVACKDWCYCMAEEWLMYEREHGSLQEVLACEDKCMQIINEVAKKIEMQENGKRPLESNDDKDLKLKRQKITEAPKPAPVKRKITVADIDSDKAVFLSNMSEDVNEEKLQALFPNATAICIPTDRKKSSKCYAYVQFPEKEDVAQALARDREPIDGRPLFISKCLLDQTQRKGTFKYSTDSENNKLFVRGLPLNYSQEDVEGIFKPHGAIAVRLVVRRNGRSKGLAYIEFSDQKTAKLALKATDELEVSDRKISVAVSAPPPKKNSTVDVNVASSSGVTRHARSRLQLPLIPRSVQVKNSDTAVPEVSKTNEDFRKLFLSKT